MSTKYHFDFNSGEEAPKFDALDYAQGPTNAVQEFESVYATFWFADLSLGGHSFSFDNPAASAYDYHCYFEVFQALSNVKVSALLKRDVSDEFITSKRFHVVDVGRYPRLQEAIRHRFGAEGPLNGVTCPFIYQVRLYNENDCKEPEGKTKKAPRVFFRLTDKGVFSVFFLDLYHELCPATNYSGDKPVSIEEQKKAR